MHRILLTGATGFVGRNILEYLNQNSEVEISVVIRKSSHEKLFEKNTAVKIFHVTPNLFQASDQWLNNICRRVDTVIHSAWYAEPGKYLFSKKNKECYEGTKNLALACSRNNIRKFVGIGSCFEYDLSKEDKLDVNSPLKPETPYALAKVKTYEDLTKIFREKNIRFSWARLFYLYGKGEDERRLFPLIRKKLKNKENVQLTEGSEIRDYLDIGEAGRIISTLALSDKTGPFNVCSGEGVSIKEIAQNIAKEYDALELLEFGSYKTKNPEPKHIVGHKTEV